MAKFEKILERLANLRMWQRRGHYAPHKPLLVLYALGQFSQGNEVLPYTAVDTALGRLLKEFGPRLRFIHTEYPFWRLQNDGLWKVIADEPLERRASNKDPKKSELITKNAAGSFSENFKDVLRKDRRNFNSVARILLENNFPETLHQDILDSVGLCLDSTSAKRKRNPEFRRRVLRAYESRCCVCGYDVRLGDIPAGIEAAHIKWYQAGGPDTERNGLALCTLHHKVFDLGGFTVEGDGLRLVFSQELAGSTQTEWLLGFHGHALRPPQSQAYMPSAEFFRWHRKTIFKAPGRDLPAKIS